MHLVGRPIEIVSNVLKEVVISDFDFEDLIQLQLFFAWEAVDAVCSTRAYSRFGTGRPYLKHYLYSRVLAPDAGETYPIRHVRDTTDWLLAHLPRDEVSFPQQEKRVRMAICQVTTDICCPGIRVALLDNHGCGADADIRKYEARTSEAIEHCFSVAAYLGNQAIISQLLTQGVDINTESEIFGGPLRNAADGGHLHLVRFLLDNGADPDAGAKDICTAEHRHALENEDARVNRLYLILGNNMSRTALGAAALRGHEEIVMLLLQPDVGISRSSYSFFRAIGYAAAGGNTNILRRIIEDACLHTFPDHASRNILSVALKSAAIKGRIETMTFLMDAGAPINRQELDEDDSALQYATIFRPTAAIGLPLQHGADIADGGIFKEPPIIWAVRTRYPPTIGLLLDHGAPVGTYSTWPLEVAVECAPICIMELLLERGVHKRYKDGGQEAFEVATREKRHDVLALFAQYGVPIPTKYRLGWDDDQDS